MAGKCTLFIGFTGEGKTTFVKKSIGEKKAHVIYDVNNEYAPSGFNTVSPMNKSNSEFISECFNYVDTTCVFEEATGFFKGRLSSDVDRLLVQKRHVRNDYYFIFHSIQSVPPQIYLMCNFIVLFKTNDEARVVKNKYSKLLPYFLDLKNKPKFSKHIIKMI